MECNLIKISILKMFLYRLQLLSIRKLLTERQFHMRSMIFLLSLFAVSQVSYASGCGGPNGGGIENIEVLSSQEIKEFKIIAWAPGLIQIRHNSEKITLINGTNRTPLQYPKGKLFLEKIRFHEYDGCDDFYIRGTNRYTMKVKKAFREYTFSWPLLSEYWDSLEIYKYTEEALIKN